MLLDELKQYLKITWVEEDGNLTMIMESGRNYLNEISGVELDYYTDFTAIQLLKDYCRYAYNHSLELFETNFKRELLRLSLREARKLHEASTPDVQ